MSSWGGQVWWAGVAAFVGFLLGSQSRLVAAALRGSVEEVEQMLRESSVADMNPCVSLRSAGLPHHDGVAHWPLRALLAAGRELSFRQIPKCDLRKKLRAIRQMFVEWE